MNAKLARIERAEAEYMENHKLKEQEAISLVEKDVSSRLGEGEASVEDANTKVKKKKKRKREKIALMQFLIKSCLDVMLRISIMRRRKVRN